MKKVFLFSLLAMFLMSLTGCYNYHGTNESIWGDGVFLVVLLPVLGALIFFWVGYKASKSGSKINPIYGGGEGGNVPWLKTGWPILGFICLATAILFLFWQIGER